MADDPITEEIRSIRRALAAKFDNNVGRILADVRQREASDSRLYVTLPARSTSVESETPVDLQPIAPLVRRIVEHLQPEEIWLIGSRAEGRSRPDSDYDLLVVLSDDAPESALDLLKAWELTCGLGVPADLVPCTRSEFEDEKNDVGTLARAAFLRGRRIYERRA